MIRFENGCVLDLHVAWAGNYPQGHMPSSLMSFSGTKGGASFELFGDEVNVASEQDGELVDSKITAQENDFFREQLEDFSGSIKTRRVTNANHVQGCAVHAIVDAIYESSAKHQPIGTPPSRRPLSV